MNKEKVTNLSVPVKYSVENFTDDRFQKVRILVMHDGLNLNGSVFAMDAIEGAKDSLKNIPILAYVKQSDGVDGADFAGHESELVLTSDGDIKYRYLGRPIGIVPSENNYHYEMYNDKTYVAVDGYIWSDYANEALDILQKDGVKSQSMEIRVDDGEWNNEDNFNITKYRYTGLTILGDEVTPAMIGAKCEMFSMQEQFSTEYYTMVDELKQLLDAHYEEEKEEVAIEEVQEVVEETVEIPVEEVQEEAEVIVEEEVPVEETIEQVEEEKFQEELAEEVEEVQEVQEEEEVQPEEDFALTIKNLSSKVTEYEKTIADLTLKLNSQNEELESLRAFKANIESEKELADKEEMCVKYSVILEKDELKEIKEKMNEYSLVQLETALNSLVAKKALMSMTAEKEVENKIIKEDIPRKANSKSKYAV